MSLPVLATSLLVALASALLVSADLQAAAAGADALAALAALGVVAVILFRELLSGRREPRHRAVPAWAKVRAERRGDARRR